MSGFNSFYGVDSVTVDEKFLAIRPKYATDPQPLGILYCHSANGFAHEPLYFGGVLEIIGELAGRGHPILSCELGGLTPWGNATAQARVSEAYRYLTTRMGARPGKVGMIGLSMGGVTSLGWAGNNPEKVAGVVGLIPALDMTDIVAKGSGGLQGSIHAAYGGAYSEASYGAVHNPQTLAVAGKYAGMPIRTYYGDSDPACLPATQVAFAAASGAIATKLTGGHDSTTLGQVNRIQVADFFKSL